LKRLFQFRLRTLLALVTLAAVAACLGIQWQQRNWARLTWMPATSSEAAAVAGTDQTSKSDRPLYGTTYEYSTHIQTRSRDVYEVLHEVEPIRRDKYPNVRTAVINGLYQYATLSAENPSDLAATVALWRKADRAKPGEIVINGIVKDRDGQPIPDIRVDVIGATIHENECCSRDNGMFVLSAKLPPGNYYLHLRAMSGKHEARTKSFALGATPQERTAVIRLPWLLDPADLSRPTGGFSR
jgi:hypothetical protein